MKLTGYNMETIKIQNRASIFRLINSEGPISKKDIAAALQLTPAAVTLICSEFMESGLLVETGVGKEDTVRAGRKKILIDINAQYRYIYGINIDSAHTTVALCNLKGRKLAAWRGQTDTRLRPEDFLQKIAEVCERLRTEHGIPKEKMAGAGVGIAGIVDQVSGDSVHAYGIWEERVAVGTLLSGLLGLPVEVENNVNAFAMAEILFGAGKDCDNMLLVKWGPGVGSSIIIDGRIYEGVHRKAAELGHYIVEQDGDICSCGRRGCLETKVGKKALMKQIPAMFNEEGVLHTDALTMEERAILARAVELLARAIVNAVTIMAPNKVVLYGEMFRAPLLLEGVLTACKRYDSEMNDEQIAISPLLAEEDYIGSIAMFAVKRIYC